jgi:hypothetical protein
LRGEREREGEEGGGEAEAHVEIRHPCRGLKEGIPQGLKPRSFVGSLGYLEAGSKPEQNLSLIWVPAMVANRCEVSLKGRFRGFQFSSRVTSRRIFGVRGRFCIPGRRVLRIGKV